jgi:GNAT superfamily N-acetyltransferase
VESVDVSLLSATSLAPHLDALARLRIAVFREFPYLYEGSLDYEAAYLRGFASSPRSALVIARAGTQVVGAATAMPLVEHGDHAALAEPLARAGIAPATVYYFGESVLLPAYRGRGVGSAFFTRREQAARAHGYRVCAFCAVERPGDHPSRPGDYRPHDSLWTRHRYHRRPDLVATFSWRDVGDADETPKPMVFWIRELDA